MSTTSPIQVFGADEQDTITVDVLRWLELAQLVLDEERVPRDAEMSLVFVDEDTIADLNARFLEGDGPTDVLAFPLDEEGAPGGRQPDEGGRGPGTPTDDGEPPVVLGDVLVCPTVARRNAEARGRTLDDELALLVVHGVLHLLDYDHAEPDETRQMQRREDELLATFRAREDQGAHPDPEGSRDEASSRDGA